MRSGQQSLALLALALIAGGALYILRGWKRSPQAYRAMIALAVCFFAAGGIFGGLIVHLFARVPSELPGTAATNSFTHSLGGPALPDRFSAKVVSITDGDTVWVAESDGNQQDIRLAGIDAPEHDQPFGAQSTAHLAGLISGKTVTLDCENEESYGRLICKILLPDGEDVCLDQVKSGMAWHNKQYEDEQSPVDRAAYAAAECAAKKAKIGLWSAPNPIQPQDWRHHTESPLLLDANGCRTTSEPANGPVVGNSRSHVFEWPSCPYYGAI